MTSDRLLRHGEFRTLHARKSFALKVSDYTLLLLLLSPLHYQAVVMGTCLKSPELYTVGWIAALSIERAAATALLHERHDTPEGFHQSESDTNAYTWGRVGKHNVVIASLPAGVYGNVSSATTVSSLVHSLPHIRIGVLVGIGGGIAKPDLDQDIRLGDIVVSQPEGTTGGVIQYDLGKAKVIFPIFFRLFFAVFLNIFFAVFLNTFSLSF